MFGFSAPKPEILVFASVGCNDFWARVRGNVDPFCRSPEPYSEQPLSDVDWTGFHRNDCCWASPGCLGGRVKNPNELIIELTIFIADLDVLECSLDSCGQKTLARRIRTDHCSVEEARSRSVT